MWPLRTALLLLWCSGCWCNDCNMTKAYFDSRNFYTVLHWDAVDIPGQEVRYHVQYIKYGDPLRPVAGCQNISTLFCDLTPVMADGRPRYFAKIMVNDICGHYLEFNPFEQTILGAPQLSTSTAWSSLTVRITAPMGPQNRSIDKISCWEKCLGSNGASLNYIVHLTHPESNTRRLSESKSGTITLNHLEPGEEYCGTVLYQLIHPSVKRQSENSSFCVTLPGKTWIHVLLVPGLVAVLLLVTSALVLCQLYVTQKNPEPKVLIMTKSASKAYYSHHQPEISNVKIYSGNTDKSEPHSPPVLHVGPKAGSNGDGYAAQEHQDLPWHCQSYTNQQVPPVRTCDQHTEYSTSYSMVLAASITGPEELSQFDSCVGDSIKSRTSGPADVGEDTDSSQVLCDPQPEQEMSMPESSCDLLVLPVSRDTDGTLKFSSIFFQAGFTSAVAHCTDNTCPAMGSTAAGEKHPFLTDLVTTDESEWVDSEAGLNRTRTYLPNQAPRSCSVFSSAETVPLVSFSHPTSNYKQNWVPRMSPETQLNNRDCTVRPVHLHALDELEEENEEEGETQSHFGSLALGGWMVQIQG